MVSDVGEFNSTSNPIQCDMTGAGRSSLPHLKTTIYFINRVRVRVVRRQRV